MNRTLYSDELYHYGMKGMRWGIRRYQNEDGTLTEEGRARYTKGLRKSERLRAKADKLASRDTSRRRARITSLENQAAKYDRKSSEIRRRATRMFFPMNADKAAQQIAKYDLKASRYKYQATQIANKMANEKAAVDRYNRRADKIVQRLEDKYGHYTLEELEELD